jgi:hypothetical protein
MCGFGRYLYRGGKPEFFCIATTPRMSHEVEVPVREWGFQSKEKQVSDSLAPDRSSFDTYCDSIAKKMSGIADDLVTNAKIRPVSGPLVWNLRLAADYIRTADVDRIRSLLAPLNPP